MSNVTPTPRTVLIVEDNQAVLDMLRAVLDDAGFETTGARCGGSAIRFLEERCFDVLVADVGLPDMSGIHVCDVARERYQHHVAILVISGMHIQERRLAALQICADDFLAKPFDLDELIARIECKVRRVPTG